MLTILTYVANRASVISFGPLGTVYAVRNEYTLFIRQINTETLLQLIGGINKFMDAIVAGSISYLSSAYISFLLGKRCGVALSDFEIGDAMTNPFKAFYTIRKCFRLRATHGTLFVLLNISTRVLTSICVVLLPISINTLVAPKEILRPDLKSDGFGSSESITHDNTLRTPRMMVDGISWHTPQAKFDLLLGNKSTSILDSYLAAQVLEAYLDFPTPFMHQKTNQLRGWHVVSRDPLRVTAIDTTVLSARAASAQSAFVKQLWNDSKTYGPPYAKHSVSFWGFYTVSTPSVEVFCAPDPSLTQSNQISFESSPNSSDAKLTQTIKLGPVPDLSFQGHSCTFWVSHALLTLNTWYTPLSDAWPNNFDPAAQVDGTVALMVDDDRDKVTLAKTTEPTTFAEGVERPLFTMLQRIQSVLSALLDTGSESSISANATNVDAFLLFLILASRELRAQNDDYATDAPTIAHLLVLWAQHLVTLADWDVSQSPDEWTTSFPVWYKVYAAGPRLRWEFAILLVPCYLFAVLFGGLCFVTWKQVKPLACVEAPGMLMAAKAIESEFGIIKVDEEMSSARYDLCLRVNQDKELQAVQYKCQGK